MILLWLIIIPVLGGILAWLLAARHTLWARWISLVTLGADLCLTIAMWVKLPEGVHHPLRMRTGPWLAALNWEWMPTFGINFHLQMDGLGLVMVMLAVWMGFMAVICSWTEITERVGFFHFNLMWIVAAVVGVFTAFDLFTFYFFWEMMLVPTYFLIGVWGHERRIYAAIKYFIFTQASGLLLLLAILALVFIHWNSTGILTFDYLDLLGTKMSASTQLVLMLGFFVAFAVKLPAVPLHTWLPDAHTQAPTGGSVDLAGLLIKTGPYALLRFCVPLFPGASHDFAPIGMALGIVGILYGAVLAFAQTDLKRLIAYTSVSHMGFVLLGIYAWNAVSHQGVIVTIVSHALSTGGLFVMAGALAERIETRDLGKLGGIWMVAPRMGGAGMILAMATLGLPGLGNFVGEFLILVGAFREHAVLAVIATLGLVTATIYALVMVQRTFHGPNTSGWKFEDLTGREVGILLVTILALVWIGLYPQYVIDTMNPFVEWLRAVMSHTGGAFPLE